MNKKLIWTTLITLLAGSCSIKKDDAPLENPQQVGTTTVQIPPINDLDKDGLRDDLENSLGRDKLTGTFPAFKVKDFNFTEIKVLDFDTENNDFSLKYERAEEVYRDLEYTPIQEKMALHSYLNLVGQSEVPDPINVFDLGVIKLSNFSNVGLIQAKNYLFKNNDDFDSQAIKISSRFFIEASNIVGVKKISNIKAEVGFVSGNGAFNTFGTTFDLISVDRQRVTFSARGDEDFAVTGKEVSVFIDRLPVETLRTILENNYDLALKIVDYKAELVDGSEFTYSTQINQALNAGTLFAISAKGRNSLFFNARKEPISDTLNRFFQDSPSSDGEGTLQGIGGLQTTTSFPVEFELAGNEQLKSHGWFLSSENNKLTDTPKVSDTVYAGYFRNDYLAKTGSRIIKRREQDIKQESFEYLIPKINLGETITIEVTGQHLKAVEGGRTSRDVPVTGDRTTCVCRGGFSHIVDPEDEEGKCGGLMTCTTVPYPAWCAVAWTETTYVPVDIDLYDGVNLKNIYFVSDVAKRPIPLTNTNFFKQEPPIKDLQENKWVINIKVDEAFLAEFGERSISFGMNPLMGPSYTYGYRGDLACGHRNVVDNFRFTDPSVRLHTTSRNFIKNLKINVNRQFSL